MKKGTIFIVVAIIVLVLALPTLGRGFAYFLNDPQACTTCHIMNPYYDSWIHSAHQEDATCNDCHVAHGPVSQWTTKAHAAFRHSWVFFLRQTPDVFDLHPTFSAPIVQDNCIRCHHEDIAETNLLGMEFGDHKTCFSCHRSTPHGEQVQNDYD